MRITGHTFIYRALTGGIAALALVMTNVIAHAGPITEQEAHSIGVDAYREMHFLGKIRFADITLGALALIRCSSIGPKPSFFDSFALQADHSPDRHQKN